MSGDDRGGGVVFSSTNISEHNLWQPLRMEYPRLCDCGKVCYPGEVSAGKAVKALRANGKERQGDGRLRPYRCPDRPHLWHVGHSE